MKYEVCDHCRHCHGKSHEYTGDGVKQGDEHWCKNTLEKYQKMDLEGK